MKLDPLPKVLTEAGWKDHKSIFQNKTGVSGALRELEGMHKECLKDHTAEKMPEVYKKMMAALEKVRVFAGDCYAESTKSKVIPKKSAEYAQKVNEAASKYKTHFHGVYQATSD